MLEQLGYLTEEDREKLKKYHIKILKNSLDNKVGEIIPADIDIN